MLPRRRESWGEGIVGGATRVDFQGQQVQIGQGRGHHAVPTGDGATVVYSVYKMYQMYRVAAVPGVRARHDHPPGLLTKRRMSLVRGAAFPHNASIPRALNRRDPGYMEATPLDRPNGAAPDERYRALLEATPA